MTTNTTSLDTAARGASRSVPHAVRFLLAFVIGTLAALLLATAAVFAYVHQYDGRVVPGVRVGNVDIGGLDRDAARAKLATAFAGLGQGKVELITSTGPKTILFSDAKRGANLDAMLDSAFRVGHTGDPVSAAVETFRTGSSGVSIPLSVTVDAQALAHKVRALTSVVDDPPINASVKIEPAAFTVVPSVQGHGVDETAAETAILKQLSDPNAPSEIAIQAKLVPLASAVSDADAASAIAAANRMIASDVTITDGTTKWTIPAKTVRTWISFGSRPDGSYGPIVDHAAAKAAVAGLAGSINKAPVEVKFLLDRTGRPVGVVGGKDGRTLDADGTGEAVATYVESLATAPSGATGTVSLVALVVHPKLTAQAAQQALPEMTKISSWTTHYDVGPQNCFSRNITIPAQTINGMVVAPGATFSFWNAVSPITTARGYCMGGVIQNGHSNHTGALGGGICSASTTMFNAALRGGYATGKRMNHYYYITRYPKGLDATVFMDGGAVQDMTWTNDTAYPVLIRGYGSPGVVTFEIWSVPNGRHVTLSAPQVSNYVRAAGTKIEYTTDLAPGVRNQLEYPTDGFDAVVTRTVTDASGKVIHFDTYRSHYAMVQGLIEVGSPKATATPKPNPTTGPTPKQSAAAPTPKPTPTPKSSGVVLLPGVAPLALVLLRRRQSRDAARADRRSA